ncbi:GGDEF domain-containing protein [Clostridium swellfunianum]|uniref:GGDEF domain-containing protein n=1 Tax=Clostridium swellfunianum TaxID=1367462 RepID=UPI00202F814E|nr:GGDEF domain-containing protein [Clostridium swellfunianum]
MKKHNALKIVAAYAVLSLIWLAISNKVLGFLSNDMEGILILDQYRGYFYVAMSITLLYFAINDMEIKHINKITTLKSKNTVLKQEMDSLRMKLDFNDHANRRLEGYANTDELTRVYNRRKGLELIREQMSQVSALKKSMLIAFIDIDNLKMINDKFGHIEGDILLTSLAKILKDSLARRDIICRYGGDEFLVVLPGACMNDMQGIKARLEAAISKHNTHSSKSYAINISMGFSEYNIKNCKHLEELIQEADDEMYISKRAKKLHYISNFR